MSLFIKKKKKQETNPKGAWKHLTLLHSDGVIAFNIYIFHPLLLHHYCNFLLSRPRVLFNSLKSLQSFLYKIIPKEKM